MLSRVNITTTDGHWLQIMICTTADHADAYCEILDQCGAMAVTLQDNADEPVFEPGPGEQRLWSQTNVIGLFAAHTHAADVLRQIQAALELSEPPPGYIKYLPDQDWERAWLDNFKPMCFGKRLWVCPADMSPAVRDAIVVRLDPGLAFGTGTHATTAQCLAWLDRHDITGMNVIDYGCGSGILAVAALKLGARSVIAIDIDEQALLATRENARKNAVQERLLARSPGSPVTEQADLLMANILARPLIELAPRFRQMLRPGGTLLVSGILADQKDDIVQAYRSWCSLDEITIRDGWYCLAGKSCG